MRSRLPAPFEILTSGTLASGFGVRNQQRKVVENIHD
jgi:hypothetical protein